MPKRRLGRKIALFCIVFAAVLSAVIDLMGYKMYDDNTVKRYKVYAESLLRVARTDFDAEALSVCIQTGEESEKYLAAQAAMCDIKRSAQISYIYSLYFPDARDALTIRFIANGYLPDDDDSYISRMGDLATVSDGEGADFDTRMAQTLWRALYENPERDGAVRFFINDTRQYGYQMTGYMPIFDEGGNPVCILALDVSMDEIKDNIRAYLINTVIGAAILLIVFLCLLLTTLNRSVISPVKRLARSAGDFVRQSEEAEGEPDKLYFKDVPVRSKDEIAVLSGSLTNMTGEIKKYMINLKAAVKEKERMAAELDLAAEIQKSMLPSVFPAFPEKTQFDIFASMEAAREVGGDLYDFFLADEDHLCVLVGDVSGKGVPAALFMAIAKALLRSRAKAGDDAARVFTDVNAQLCENNGGGLFVTAWMGVLELSTGKLTYVNAGHNPPLIKRAGGAFEYLRMRPGFVLAGMEGIRYKQFETELGIGDALYVYTDGVTEAMNQSDEQYGEDRLQKALNAGGDAPRELIARVSGDVRVFVSGAPQSDDITMLALKILSR